MQRESHTGLTVCDRASARNASGLATDAADPQPVLDWGGWGDLETFLDRHKGTYNPEVQRRPRDNVEWL